MYTYICLVYNRVEIHDRPPLRVMFNGVRDIGNVPCNSLAVALRYSLRRVIHRSIEYRSRTDLHARSRLFPFRVT